MRAISNHFLLFLLILLVTTILGEYENQVILKIGDENAVNKAATFLYKKHSSTSNSYMYHLNKAGNPEQLEKGKILEVDWKKTRIQIVAHGDPETKKVGDLAPDKIANVVNMLTKGESTNKISIVSCMSNSGDSNVKPDYLEEFANELKYKSVHSIEISARSALVSVDNNWRKLTGEIVHSKYTPYTSNNNPEKDGSGYPKVEKGKAGILWSRKDKAVKWIAKISETGSISIDKAPISSESVTRFVGVIPKGQVVYLTNTAKKTTSIINDEEAYDLLNE